MGYRVVVAGATGNVGREMLNILAEREFPIDEIAAVASSRSQGDVIEFGETGKTLKVQNIENFDWTGWDMALFAIGSDATAIYAPKAAAAGEFSSLRARHPRLPSCERRLAVAMWTGLHVGFGGETRTAMLWEG